MAGVQCSLTYPKSGLNPFGIKWPYHEVHNYKCATINMLSLIQPTPNVDNEAEVDRILVQADILVPDSPPELLGAVGLSHFVLYMYIYMQGGWHRERGATEECGPEGTLARNLLCVFHVAMGMDIHVPVKCCHV